MFDKPINFEILYCEYNSLFTNVNKIDFLNNLSFFTTIENLYYYGFRIKKDSIMYSTNLDIGFITIIGNNCEMKIRLRKYSYLCKEYLEMQKIWRETGLKSKQFSKTKLQLELKIKKRIKLIYKTLFDNV